MAPGGRYRPEVSIARLCRLVSPKSLYSHSLGIESVTWISTASNAEARLVRVRARGRVRARVRVRVRVRVGVRVRVRVVANPSHATWAPTWG